MYIYNLGHTFRYYQNISIHKYSLLAMYLQTDIAEEDGNSQYLFAIFHWKTVKMLKENIQNLNQCTYYKPLPNNQICITSDHDQDVCIKI